MEGVRWVQDTFSFAFTGEALCLGFEGGSDWEDMKFVFSYLVFSGFLMGVFLVCEMGHVAGHCSITWDQCIILPIMSRWESVPCVFRSSACRRAVTRWTCECDHCC